MTALRIPIAVKLITITIALLLSVAAGITVFSVRRFEEIAKDREAQANQDQSRARATEVEGLLISYIDKAKVVASLLMKDPGSGETAKALDLTFHRDKDFVAVEVIARDQAAGAAPLRVVNETYLKQYKLDGSFLDVLRGVQNARQIIHRQMLFSGREGALEVRNSTIEGGAPLITIGFPLAKDDLGAVTHIVLAEMRLDRLQKVFAGISERSLYLVDSEGRLLAHPDEPRVLKGESFASVPIVKSALTAEVKQAQLRYADGGEGVTAAFTKTALGVTAVAAVSDAVILEPARAVKREAIYVAGRILSVALFLIFVF